MLLNKTSRAIIFFAAFLALVFFAFHGPKETQAGTEHNVSGWAWSANIGWISFNNTTGGGTTNYGVNINPSTGIFSDYAWSRGTDTDVGGVGWISFADFDGDGDIDASDKNISGSPCAPNCEARLDLETKQVSGWARALTDGGGWDGWIKLRGSNYGVSWNPLTQELEGWAWSDMVIGWISFNRVNCDPDKDGFSNGIGACPSAGTPISNYKVIAILNQSPSVTSTSETLNPCAYGATPQVASGLSVTLHWTYSDPEGNPQNAYEIWLDNNSAFPDPKFNHLVESSSSTSYALDLSQDDNSDWLSSLAWGTTYYWKVRVKDSFGNWSNWSSVDSFITPAHAYPYVDFTWSPSRPAVNELTQFTDLSEVYGGATKSAWSWQFQNGDPATSTLQNPKTKFTSTGAKIISLRVTDSTGYSCTGSKTVNISLPFPEWEEIPPF